jgi:hypothetical protein
MIEIGRRRFITGLAALVAAPAVIRIAPLMPISSRHIPLYVPAQWLLNPNDWTYEWKDDLEVHAWRERLHADWVNLNDHNPAFVEALVRRTELERYQGPWA